MIYATTAEVAARLGRELTPAEQTQVSGVLVDVGGLLNEAAGKPAAWVPVPPPPLFKTLSVEKAVAVVANPLSLASESEQLGAYQHSQTFQRGMDVGIFLTEHEDQLVADAVYAPSSGSSTARSLVDRIVNLRDGREVDDDG